MLGHGTHVRLPQHGRVRPRHDPHVDAAGGEAVGPARARKSVIRPGYS